MYSMLRNMEKQSHKNNQEYSTQGRGLVKSSVEWFKFCEKQDFSHLLDITKITLIL